MNKPSYFPNYYSIEDVLVTQEKVPCDPSMILGRMGFLDASSQTPDLNPGQSVELPLWYLQNATVRTNYFKITIPDIYQSAYTEICKADPNAVELGRLNKYFYEFGRYIVRFDRHNTVGKMLYETCRERAVYLKDLCNNINNESRQDSKLENLENLLFEEGCKTNREFASWLLEHSSNITVAEIVENHRKRKRAIMQMDAGTSSSQTRNLRNTIR